MKQLFWWLGKGIKCIFVCQAEGCCLLSACVVALLWLETEQPPKTGDFFGGRAVVFLQSDFEKSQDHCGCWELISARSHPPSAKPPWARGDF